MSAPRTPRGLICAVAAARFKVIEYSPKSRQVVTVFLYARLTMDDDILIESFEGRSPKVDPSA